MEIQTENGIIILAKVPLNAFNFRIKDNVLYWDIAYLNKESQLIRSISLPADYKDKKLRFITNSLNARCEYIEPFVRSMWFDSDIIGGGYYAYENYMEEDCWLDTPNQSFESLLQSKGIYTKVNYAIIKMI